MTAEYNPRLGTAPEASAMMAQVHDQRVAWLREHQHDAATLFASFDSIATCARPVAIKRTDVEDGQSPTTLFGLRVVLDDTLPVGEFRFSEFSPDTTNKHGSDAFNV